jgi:hypothetical protein
VRLRELDHAADPVLGLHQLEAAVDLVQGEPVRDERPVPNARESRWRRKKLEERAEEIVDAYLRAGVEQGDWRALDALVNRVYGKPKETVAVEREESPVERRLREVSTEELEALVQRGRQLGARRFESRPRQGDVSREIPGVLP